ncbi:hypothetical protein NX722_06725 [Endozoicomonas gorgoniicola]|uniref:Uncharacterized protein n=1 Tax=Endozoicomonas gorgoniicola TaxID=1234144 RepID=A0ABT3MTL4_9GAMM|nr:hypothetical protein [Endozoicomonas gorgoniicola]MCW7552344.1 hypothetical protein [Endozoicomonas gorgoniicola]
MQGCSGHSSNTPQGLTAATSPEWQEASGSGTTTHTPEINLKRSASDALASGTLETPPAKRLTSRTGTVRFADSCKAHDGGESITRQEFATAEHRIAELGLDDTIPHHGVAKACQDCLNSFSDPEDLMLLTLWAKDKQVDTSLIHNIEKKLATVLCSDFLLRDPTPCDYPQIQRLHESLNTCGVEQLDDDNKRCLENLRNTVMNDTKRKLNDLTKKYTYNPLFAVAKFYVTHYSPSTYNQIDQTGKTEREVHHELVQELTESLENYLTKLGRMIPANVMVSQFLEDNAPADSALEQSINQAKDNSETQKKQATEHRKNKTRKDYARFLNEQNVKNLSDQKAGLSSPKGARTDHY